MRKNPVEKQVKKSAARGARAPANRRGADEQTRPIRNRPIQWAVRVDAEERGDVPESCEWINEELIAVSQKQWRCSREVAVRRLGASLDESSA